MPLTRNQANSRNTSSQQRQPDPPNNLPHPRNGRNGNGNGTGINVFLPPHHESNSGIFMGQDAGGGASQTRLNGGDLQSDGNDRVARASNQTDEFFQSESHDGDHLAQTEGEEQEEEEEEEGSGISQDHNDGIIRNLSLEMLNQNDSDLLDDRRNRNMNNDNNNNSNNQHHQFNFSSLNETQQEDEEMFNHHHHHQLSISRPQSPLSMTRSIQDQYSSRNGLQDSSSQSQEAVQEEFLDLQRRSQTSTGGRNSDLEHQSHSMDQRNQQMTATTPRQEFMRIQSPSPGMGMAKPVRLQQSSPTSPLLPQRSQSRQSLMRELHFNDGADGIHLDSSNASSPNLSLNQSSSSSSIPLSGSLSQPLPNLRSGSSRSMNQNSQSSSGSQPSSSQSSSTSSYSHSQPLFQFRTRSQQAIARIDSSSSSGSSISLNPSSQNNNIGRASNHSHSLSLGENGQIESSMPSDGRASTNPNSVLHSTSGLNGTGNGNDVFTFPSRPSVLTRGLSSPMTSTNKSQRMNLGESLNLTMSNNNGMQSQSSRQNQRRSGDELDLSPTDQGSQNRLSAIFKTPLNEVGSGRFGRNNNLQTPISNVNASVFSNSTEGSERLSDVNGLNGINNGSHGLFSPFTTPQRSDADDHHDHGYQFTGNRNGNSNRLGGADRFERRSNRPDQFEDANMNEDYLQEEVEIPSRNHHFHNHHIVPSNGHSQSQSQDEVERDELADEQNIRNDVLPSSIPDLTDYSTSIENILSNKEEEERLELIELIKYIDEHRSGLKSNPSAGNEKKRYLTELERKRICQHMQVYNDAQQLVVASLFGMDRSNISKISANSEKWLKVSEELIKGTHPVPPHDAILETYKRSQSWCSEMKESGLKVTDSQLRERIPFFAHKVGFNSRNAASWNDWLSKYVDNITFEECLNHGWKDYPAIKIAKKKESSRKGKGKKDKEKPKGKGRSTVDVGIGPSNYSSNLDANHLNRSNHFQSPSISSSYQETQDGTFSPSASSIISNTATSISAHSRKSSSSSRINRSNLGLSQDDFIQDSSSQNSGTDGLGISFTRNFPNLQNQKNLQRSIHDRNQNQHQNNPDPNENLMSRGSSYQSNTTNNSSTTSNSGSSFAFSNLSHSRISSQPQSRSNSNHNNVMSDKSLSNSGSEGYADDSGLSFPTESNTKTVDSSRERNGDLIMNSSSPQTTPKSSHKRHYDLMRQDLPLSSMNEIRRTSDDDVMMEDRDESSANGFNRRLLQPRVMGDPSDRLSPSFVDPFASNQRRLESSDRNQDQLSMPSRNDNADHSNNGSLKRRRTDHQRSQGDRLEVDEEEEERNFLSKRSPIRQRIAAVDSDRNRWNSSVFPSVSTFVSTDGIADKRRRVQSSNSSMPLTDRSTGLPLRSPFTQNETEKFRSNDEDWSNEIERSRSRERMGGKEALEYESGNRIVTPSTSSTSTLRGMTSSDPRGSQYHQQPKVNHHHHLRLHSSSGSSPQRNLRNRNNLHHQQQQQSQLQSQRSPSPYATSSTSSRLQQTVFDERSRSQSPRNPNLRTRSRSSTNVTNKSTDARRDPGNGLELEQDSNSVSSSTPRFNPSSPFIGTDLGIEEGDMVTIDQAQRSLAVVLRFLSDQPDNYVARSDCFALGSLQATLHAHASAERANNQDEQQR